MASVGLEALGGYKLGGVVRLKTIFETSLRVGGLVRGIRGDHRFVNGNGNGNGTTPVTGKTLPTTE
jgi:hypothetical protein